MVENNQKKASLLLSFKFLYQKQKWYDIIENEDGVDIVVT